MNRLEESVASYQQAIRLRQDYPEAHNNLGSALANQGNLTAAIACFREALRRDPKLDQTREDLRKALDLRGRTGPTLEQLEATARENPHNTFAKLDLAQALYDKQQYLRSIEVYRELLVIDPSKGRGHPRGGGLRAFLFSRGCRFRFSSALAGGGD